MSDELETADGDRNLNCPRCSAKMETVVFQDIKVDRCTSCKGLWFDALEKEHLDGMRGSETIDVGTAGKSVSPAPMNCPVCHTRMIDMVDMDDPALHFNSCKICFGLFFDAGEYREHKEHSTLSFFHQLFHRRPK
jgi:Zn-finger nucleic acid-binding protein